MSYPNPPPQHPASPQTYYPQGSPPGYGPPPNPYQHQQDESQLQTLSILYYVMGVFSVLGVLTALLYVAIGIFGLNAPPSPGDSPSSNLIAGGILIGMGALGAILATILTVYTFKAAKCIAQRRRYNLIFILAILKLLNFPIGTAVGIFALVVLSRPSVKALFEGIAPPTYYPPAQQPWVNR
ncbi:MAG: hypothetical protein H7Z41_17030 [Cytophagales bacterium]|nr:hypothetical protein [Armatimonadota bacterium]